MYKAFFGLTDSPFKTVVDTRLLYRSRQHEEALDTLLYGVQTRKGLIVLTGEAGTGKTVLLLLLRELLAEHQIGSAYLFHSRQTVEQFFELLAHDLELGCGRSKPEILIALEERLREVGQAGQTTALLLDDAHNLEADVLEEMRLLGNLENGAGKLLQVVLAGPPELERRLRSEGLRQLRQRVAVWCVLEPLEEQETADYITTRLANAGMRHPSVFPRPVLAEVHARSRGIPAVINTICDRLLLTAFAMESKVGTLEMLDEVTAGMRLDRGPGTHGDAQREG